MAGGWSIPIHVICKKQNANMINVVRKVSFEAFKRVVLRSPVDTGRFRANWGVRIGSPWLSTVEVYDKDGRGTVALAQQAVMEWNAQGSIYLSNSLPYGPALEYSSHSGQAPNGMVRVTCAEMKAWIEANAARESIGDIRSQTGGSD